ncbi:hypothetical protein IS267_004462 [Salmonella enterica]|nr:hypothetical protein [Salmonella enterica]
MSLEAQIAALVQASNNLTGAVNGKIGEIDKSLAEFEKNAPIIARAQAYKTVYLSNAGNDNNDGLSDIRPKRTLQSAVNEGLVGGTLHIYLCSDFLLEQDVSFSSNIYVLPHPNFYQANARRPRFSVKREVSENVVFTDGSTGHAYFMRKLFGQNSSASFTMNSVDLDLPAVTAWATVNNPHRRNISVHSAFVSFGNIDGVSHYNSFNLLSSTLTIGDNGVLVDGNYHVEPYSASIVRASLYNVQTTKGVGANVFGQNVWFRNGRFVSAVEVHDTKRGD